MFDKTLSALLAVPKLNRMTESTTTNQDYSKLNVPNRISFWLENFYGWTEYNKPNNFFNFTSTNNPKELQTVSDSLTWLMQKILKQNPPPKPASYLFVQNVSPSGQAGAIYTYPIPTLQNDKDIATLQGNVIAEIQKWCSENNQTMNPPQFNPTDIQYLRVTIDLPVNNVSI